jgi:hypothetical protein
MTYFTALNPKCKAISAIRIKLNIKNNVFKSTKLFIILKELCNEVVSPSKISVKLSQVNPDISTGNIFNIVLLRTKMIVSKIKSAIMLFKKVFDISYSPKNKT